MKSLEEGRCAPLLRWAGSKKKILPLIFSLVPSDFSRYVEPFAGSAALYFALSPKRATLGDVNPELIRAYKAIKRDHIAISAHLNRMRRSKKLYMQLRRRNAHGQFPFFEAARFIYLNRFCFNGLYRTNATGKFNVPYGAKGTGKLPSEAILESVAQALRPAKFVCGDFEEVLDGVERNSFVYMDPPYAVGARRVFSEYHPDSFTSDDLKRLRNCMKVLRQRKIKFIVSYAMCDEARELAEGFATRSVLVRRNIAGFTDRRARSRELLILNL